MTSTSGASYPNSIEMQEFGSMATCMHAGQQAAALSTQKETIRFICAKK